MSVSAHGFRKVQLVECPRDAMQGWKTFVPTDDKINYINTLLKVGFHTIDCGSFVSPRAIPQMADTREVVEALELDNSHSKLLVIVANQRGAQEATGFDQISYLGFPFSVSETFQQRNTNSSIIESFERVKEIQELCERRQKQLVIYISMGFGNPYGDVYSNEIVYEWVEKLSDLGISIISLADTVGLATPEQVFSLVDYLVKKTPDKEIGVHLHSTPDNWKAKLDAATRAGCLRFDGALKGIGGCPMANDVLVGNMNTESMLTYFEEKGMLPEMDKRALSDSLQKASQIFK